MSKRILLPILAVSLLAALVEAPAEPALKRPRLLVFIVVDQLRYDYLTRLADEFQGGLRRLLSEGADFTSARHAHAVTTTGPGHASLSTGTFPSRSGIINNAWYDRSRGEEINCVEDPDSPLLEASGSGRSPRNLLRDTLGDWLKRVSADSLVFGASRKDRGAILISGKKADAAFWYDGSTGRFVSSHYYMDQYPAWVRDFNDARYPDTYFARQWTPLAEAKRADGEAGFGELDEGAFPRRLPKTIGDATLVPDSDFYSDFGSTPYMDEYLERFAEALIENEGLGSDDNLDLLALSFSALDSVGHEYGPNSGQSRDAVLRLDRTLGRLFDYLDGKVGLDRVVVSLSADHGVMSVPEYETVHGGTSARRFNEQDRLCVQRAGSRLRQEWGPEKWFLGDLYLNYETLGRLDRKRSDLEREVARRLEECDAIEHVWTRTELESTAPGERLEQFRRSFNPGRSADLMLQLKEFVISYPGRGTTHGSPYDYDTHVPFLIRLPDGTGVSVSDPVWTVDMAPTLARLLGIEAPDDLDGMDRSNLIRGHVAGLR